MIWLFDEEDGREFQNFTFVHIRQYILDSETWALVLLRWVHAFLADRKQRIMVG